MNVDVPGDARVLGLLLEDLVGLVSNDAWDVVGLGGSAGGVHEDHGSRAQDGVVEGTGEQLVVSAVDRVSVIKHTN
jgi:hypothetical protein